MSPEIQPADPRLRRRILALMALAGTLGAAATVYLFLHVSRLKALAEQKQQPLAAERAQATADVFLVLMAAAAFAVAVLLVRVSLKTLRSERFPPPGSRVIADTVVLRGEQARRRGHGGLALAVATLFVAALVISQIDRALRFLLTPRLQPTLFELVEEPETPPPEAPADAEPAQP